MVIYDEFGPEKIIEVYNPRVGMKGFLVIDNTALGPAKGGIRMTPSVNLEEVARLARAMTWKCALAELPFGGGKSGIIADDKQITPQKKKELIKAFAASLKAVVPELYVAAPDMNTAEEEMKLFADTLGTKKACTGKPAIMGGIPHELGSTGFGVVVATTVGAASAGIDLSHASVAIEGFGNVGQFAAKFITEKGARLVAVSDSRGVIFNSKGLSYEKLMSTKQVKGTVTSYGDGKILPSHEITRVTADILITAAIPDLITVDEVDHVKAKLIVEGSNIPMTFEVEELFHNKGILVIPDFVANAGGVISSYVEYIGGTPKQMWKTVEEKIKKNTALVLKEAHKKHLPPRTCALEIAKKRVLAKCKNCRI